MPQNPEAIKEKLLSRRCPKQHLKASDRLRRIFGIHVRDKGLISLLFKAPIN